MAGTSLILASASPRRKKLLADAGYQFTVVPSAAQEIHDPTLAPQTLVTTNARLKATEVAAHHPGSLALGADTLVYLQGEPLGKPADLDQAFHMLRSLAGKTHQVATGVALVGLGQKIDHTFCETTQVTFHTLSDQEILSYLDSISPLDKAGGYAAQDNGERIIAHIRGSMSNVIGLPLTRLGQELRHLGLGALLPPGD